MRIEERKLKLIEWIVALNDKSILLQIDSLRKKVMPESYHPLKKMTHQELKSELKQAEDDFKKGKTISIEELKKEIKNW